MPLSLDITMQQAAGVHEVTSAAFGRKAGAARTGPAATSIKTRSRLSSAALFEQWKRLVSMVPACADQLLPHTTAAEAQAEASPQLRRKAKQDVGVEYQEMWRRLRSESSLFEDWILKETK